MRPLFSRQNKLFHGVATGLLASLTSLILWCAGLLEWIERPLWDLRVRICAKPSQATDKIRLIFLDQDSLDWARKIQGWPWPWPREAYAAVVDFCRRARAKSLVFDVLFTEPSRDGVEDDLAFRDAITGYPAFATAVMPSFRQGEQTYWPSNYSFQGLAANYTDDNAHNLPRPIGVALPIEDVGAPCRFLGSVYAKPDRDNVVRRLPPILMFDNKLIPAVGLAAYFASSFKQEIVEIGRRFISIGGLRIPLDREGMAILKWRGPSQTHKTVSVQAVIQSEIRLREGQTPVIQPEDFKDCYVFFGFTAHALGDLHATPMGPLYPGVECHATLLDNLISNDFPSDAPLWMCIGWTLIAALLGGVLARFCSKPWMSAAILVLAIPFPMTAGFVAFKANYWLPVAPSHVACPFAAIASLIVNYAVEGRQKRFIKNAFKQYLSPHVIDRLLEDPSQLRLGGETRELTIYFSDVKGFTSISESMSPAQLTSLLNEYLTAMTDIIMEEGGTVDKYEGDAIIAFWNAPIAIHDHASRGVRAAIRCQEKLAQMRPLLAQKYGHELYCRIGLNTGHVVIGNMGSSQRFNYTFLGDAGNLASRLEGANKIFGTGIMVSEFTARSAGSEFVMRELAKLRVVGRKEPVRVFEPMTKEQAASKQDILDAFERGLKAFYEGRFADAAHLFEMAADRDCPAKTYLHKCRILTPNPPESWSGVWELMEK